MDLSQGWELKISIDIHKVAHGVLVRHILSISKGVERLCQLFLLSDADHRDSQLVIWTDHRLKIPIQRDRLVMFQVLQVADIFGGHA